LGLARLFSGATGLGQLIIRNLGDVGGPPASRVSDELDSIIAWTKASLRNIKTDTSTVGNVGAGLDVLHTYTLTTPNRLATDGDYLTFYYGGSFAANDTDKRVNGFFGGTAYENAGVLDIDGGNWELKGRIVRLSSTSVRVSSTMNYFALQADSAAVVTTFGVGFLSITRMSDITGLSDLGANDMVLEVKGEGAANNDVQQKMSIIELRQQ
jgi:hypothetical protein